MNTRKKDCGSDTAQTKRVTLKRETEKEREVEGERETAKKKRERETG